MACLLPGNFNLLATILWTLSPTVACGGDAEDNMQYDLDCAIALNVLLTCEVLFGYLCVCFCW